MRKIAIATVLYILIFSAFETFAQTSAENWVPVTTDKEKTTYINVNGLSAFKENDIFVWVLQEMSSPISMDEIDGDIYKSKTYYLFSKELKRYSIMQIIYYDEKGNVLKHYSYERNMENPNFKYSSPIISDSETEKVLEKCLEFISPGIEKNK